MPDGDMKICLSEADAFLSVAHSCISSTPLAGLSEMIYPIVVNAAFSCELSLKAIMMARSSTSEFSTGHKLKTELFSKLSSKDRNEIAKRANASLGMEFDSALEEFDGAFANWRYAFEEEVSIHYIELVKFAELLLGYAKELAA